MKDINVIIADDDQPSRTILFHFIKMLPEFKIVGEAATGDEFIKLAMKEKPDIALVDISMPGINGLEAVKACKGFSPSLQVIFTTGHDEFAVEAFNLSATDYIVKPVERTRLWIALEKCKTAIQLKNQFTKMKQSSNKLSIKSNNSFMYLDTEEILFIEREGRKTVLQTTKGRFETTESLVELEEKLPKYFYKTHRSYLVNLNRIRKIESSGETYLAFFTDDSKKPAHISKLKINNVHELLNS